MRLGLWRAPLPARAGWSGPKGKKHLSVLFPLASGLEATVLPSLRDTKLPKTRNTEQTLDQSKARLT